MENYGVDKLGIAPSAVYRNLCPAELVEKAIMRGEGKLTDKGALLVNTGKYTGRSPKDKFIVDSEAVHDNISWGSVNRPISRDVFNSIKNDMIEYLNNKEVFIFDGFAGADKKVTRKFRVINELPAQNLFIRNLLIRPTDEELENFGEADFTILVAPGYKCDPEKYGINSEAAIIIDYEAKFAIIAGSAYSGEIKKTVFCVMNYVMPVEENILPMHCSANMDPETGDTAVFFGLQVQERQLFLQIQTESLSVMMSTAGLTKTFSTLRADVTQNVSTLKKKESLKSIIQSDSVLFWKMLLLIRTEFLISTMIQLQKILV